MGADPSWVRISDQTMRELRARGDQRSAEETLLGPPVNAWTSLTGHPVHFVDGKWYIEITPSNIMSANEVRGILNIQEMLENGTVMIEEDTRCICVWQHGQWLKFDQEIFLERGIDLPRPGSTWSSGPMTTSTIARLKEWQAVRDEEVERLALRQLLAETQQEDDEDGDD